MAVAFAVGDEEWPVGTGDFLYSFFSTVSARLEPEGWGSRFPATMDRLYAGELAAAEAGAARAELEAIRAELRGFPPSEVVWDYEDRSLQPPWRDDIAAEITDLGNYFVTSEGEDLIAVLDEALAAAASKGQPLTIG